MAGLKENMLQRVVSFETACIAREKGFDYNCIYKYNLNGEIDSNGEIEAPFQTSLQNWLRVTHEIEVHPERVTTWVNNVGYRLLYKGGRIRYGEYTQYHIILQKKHDTYEEALERVLYEACGYIEI